MSDFKEPENGSTSDNSDLTQDVQDKSSSQSVWEGFSDDDNKYVEDKGWKAPQDLLKSYRELEKQSSTKISIPKDEDADAWNKLYSKLGRPESADKYELSVNEADKADIQKLMFDTNQTPKQAEALIKGYEDLLKAKQKLADEQIDAENKKQEESLIAEWGDNATRNKELAVRGAKLFGLEESDLEAVKMVIGSKKYLSAMVALGEAISEDNVPMDKSNKTTERQSLVDFYKSLK